MPKAVDRLHKINVDDVIVFKKNNKVILYSALDKIILELSNEVYDELQNNRTIDFWKSLIDPDGQFGLFSSKKPDIDTYIAENNYDGIVLLLTDKCNMNCKYCYASDSRHELKVMDEETCLNIIDIAFKNKKNSLTHFSVAFHGYGECTLHKSIIQNIVQEVKARCKNQNIKPQFQVTTNGTFDDDFCEWMIKENFRFDISIDGNKEINDLMRFMKSGKSAHDKIVSNIKRIAKSDSKSKLTVRATVTNKTVDKMAESTEFIAKLGVAGVHFEPITPRGGALELGENYAVDINDFTRNYLKSAKVASDYGIKIYYGPINFGIAVRFCSSKNKLVVDLHGRVIGCLQSGPDSGLDVFHYANISNSKHKLTFLPGKLEHINSFSVYDKPMCNTCLLKYHCSGDCTAHNMDLEANPTFIKNKCDANENLFADILEDIISEGKLSAVLDFDPEVTFQC